MTNTLNPHLYIILPTVQSITVNDIINENYFRSNLKKRTISLYDLKKKEKKNLNLAKLLMDNVINKKTRNTFSTNQNLINILKLFYK
jgi:hypothetical protein